MMKTVNTIMGLSLFVVLGGMALAACKTAPVVQSDKAPACCTEDAGDKAPACCTEDAGTEQTPTSSTTTAPTDLDAGVVVAPPAPSATDNK